MTNTLRWATAFYHAQRLGVQPVHPAASVDRELTDEGLTFTFHAPAPAGSTPGALRAVGDPDLYLVGDQVRVQLAWGSSHVDKLYVQASSDGNRCGEYGDRRLLDEQQWSCVQSRAEPGWQVRITLPWHLLPPAARGDVGALQVALVWCSPTVGLTAWPTPFVTWNAWRLTEAALRLDTPAMPPEQLTRRAEELLNTLEHRLGSFPDHVPDFDARFASLLIEPQSPDALAHTLHRRAAAAPVRTFLQPDGDPEGVPNHDRARNLALLEQFDATGSADAFYRGEMLVNLASLALHTGDDALAQQVQRSVGHWLRAHPITRGLQPRVPRGAAGSPTAFPDVWAAHINGSYTLGLLTRALYTLSMRQPIDGHLLALALKRGSEAYRFGLDHIASHYHWNHSINWLNKMVELATLGLEMRDAQERIATCWRCMEAALGTMVLPDGVSQELCAMYHFVAAYRLQEALDAARDADLSPPRALLQWEAKLLEGGLLAFQLPLGVDAGFSDSGGLSPEGWARPVPNRAAYLRRVCRQLERPDLLYIVTGGAEGDATVARSHAARYAGVYAVRTGWSPQDSALVLDAGPLGRAHAHDDRLNFVYSYKSRCLLPDHTYPGGLGADGWNARSAAAHNTVTVDGFRSDYIEDFSKRVNRTRQTLRFAQSGPVHGLEARHVLEELAGPRRVEVRRRILTRPDRFIWVIDTLTGEGRCTSHTRFVLPAGAVQVSGSAFATQFGDIDLAGRSLDGLTLQMHTPDWPPEAQGRPVLDFVDADHALPRTHSFLLVPFEQGRCMWPEVTAQVEDEAAVLELRWPDGQVEQAVWPVA